MAPGQHFIEHHAQRKKVGADRGAGTLQLLGRHVHRCTGEVLHSRQFERQTGESEVHEPHPASPVDHDVGGLQIAVQNAVFVGGAQTGANLPGNLKSFFTGRTAHPSQDRGQIFAVDVFHGEEVLSVEMTDVEDAADIGMRDLASETNLAA